MILDGRSTALPEEHQADVAIVGAGAAGIALARVLDDRFTVLLVEAGDTAQSADTHDDLKGEVSGLCYPLDTTRARGLGGSTALWAGYCTPFDAIDFTRRSWVPGSGWPLSPDELLAYHNKAARYLHLPDACFSPAVAGPDELRLSSQHTQEGLWRFGVTLADFGQEYLNYFLHSRTSHVLTHTCATDVRLHDSLSGVSALRIRHADGREGTVRARQYVIAAGGLETPRLLLASDQQLPCGVGNQNDQVGRWFMEHPHVSVIDLQIRRSVSTQGWSDRLSNSAGQRYLRCAGFSPDAQRKARILNSRLHLYRSGGAAPDSPVRAGLFTEQAPNPDSRVTLGSDVDRFGLRRLRLHWSLNELDRHSHRVLTMKARDLLVTSGVAEQAGDEDNVPQLLHSNHQLGTTRMSVLPDGGVVDAHCRVHGIDNLYIAGGSVFPTVSWANPTFMVLLLTLRLADHLRTVCDGCSPQSPHTLTDASAGSTANTV